MGMDKVAKAAMDELARKIRQIDSRGQLPSVGANYRMTLTTKPHKTEVYSLGNGTLAYFEVVDDNGGVLKPVKMTSYLFPQYQF